MNIVADLKSFAKDLTILVAEDDKELNSELVSLLKIFFKNVDFAYDGEEGLRLFKLNRPDIVLSDITMPKLDGIKMATEIKIVNRTQPIVILSAHTELQYIIPLIDIGISQFVAKPFESDNLLYRLLKVSEEIVSKKYYEQTREI